MKAHTEAGFVISCVGDDRTYSIVESRYANTLADRVLKNVLHSKGNFKTYSFLKRGSDERQYNAPGVELPCVCFCRSKFGEYPEYHTSADDMSLICPDGFRKSFAVMTEVIRALEQNEFYQTQVLCEPQLGKRGLYPTISQKGSYDSVVAMTDLLAYADGTHDLIDISDRIGVPIANLLPIVETLQANALLQPMEPPLSAAR